MMGPNEINLCKCGSCPKYFKEAMMASIRCKSCQRSLMIVGNEVENIKERWNRGERGFLETGHHDPKRNLNLIEVEE